MLALMCKIVYLVFLQFLFHNAILIEIIIYLSIVGSVFEVTHYSPEIAKGQIISKGNFSCFHLNQKPNVIIF